MITIDRTSNTPVHEQLAEQLRFLIASGHFKIDETLPSTRGLGNQVGVSFHTVRKAYQQLEQDGLLVARVGSGYRVKERVTRGKGERMERGAAVVQEALQRLIGLGLDSEEIEYLFEEQRDLLDSATPGQKLVFAAPFREMADACAEQVALALQQNVEPTTLDRLTAHQDADYVFAAFPDLQTVMEGVPRADAVGVITYLDPKALARVARMLGHETLGLVTRHADAIAPLMAHLRAATRFSGQTIAASIDEGARHLQQFIDQTDLIVYTPQSRRRLLPLLEEAQPRVEITPLVSRDSLEELRQVVPT